MRFPLPVALLLVLLAAAASPAGGLEDLARQGRWPEILDIARRREAQLPLTGVQALVAAEAAERLDEPGFRRELLESALSDPVTGQVARVELATLLAPTEPGRAVDLLLPVLRRPVSRELAHGAAMAAAASIRAGISPAVRSRLHASLRKLPRSARRTVEVELAVTGRHRHQELARILQAGRTDLADLRAAEALLGLGPAGPKERWLVARSLYRHAHYHRALRLLEGLTSRSHPGVSLWKARFLRGRCLFRLERWKDAATWYRRARAAARHREDRAALLVHEARALELAGRHGPAMDRARRALTTRPSDQRRLFLARLELAAGKRRAASHTLSGLRRRTARDRGLILRAVDAHARGKLQAAVELLLRTRGRTWRGPALVLAAAACRQLGDPSRAASLLQLAAATHLDRFWALQALQLASSLPAATQRRFSEQLRAALAEDPSRPREAVRRWAALATAADDPEKLRDAAASALGLRGSGTLRWTGTLAQRLWESGLPDEAALWNPRGFPRTTAFEATWSAHQLLLSRRPSWAIRLADAALQRLATGLPARCIPISLQRSLFPLPFPGPVLEAATRYGLEWPLLAAVAREESRWNPRALSAVGARGLTQMMPRTAAETAARAGIDPPAPSDLFRPTVSLRLGAAELARLLRELHSAAAATAAYNAGEPQTRLWLRFAGPQSGDAWFVAAIGFGATRSYTEDVLWAFDAYRTIWEKVVPADHPPSHVSRRSATPPVTPIP